MARLVLLPLRALSSRGKLEAQPDHHLPTQLGFRLQRVHLLVQLWLRWLRWPAVHRQQLLLLWFPNIHQSSLHTLPTAVQATCLSETYSAHWSWRDGQQCSVRASEKSGCLPVCLRAATDDGMGYTMAGQRLLVLRAALTVALSSGASWRRQPRLTYRPDSVAGISATRGCTTRALDICGGVRAPRHTICS